VGRFTSAEDVATAARAGVRALAQLRADAREAAALAALGGARPPPVPQLPPTRLEYMEDTYRVAGSATVLRVAPDEREEDDPRPGQSKLVETPRMCVVLDRTLFHPQGGGQPSDQGEMRCALTKAVFHVEFATREKDSGLVLHYGFFEPAQRVRFGANATVEISVDRRQREWHARMHSAGHLIDQAMLLCGLQLRATKGCHVPGQCSVEYEGLVPLEERAQLKEKLEEKCQQLINECIQTKVMMLTEEEAQDCCIEGQAPHGLPQGHRTRVVLVGGQKGCPCGGTHVANTKQIAKLVIKKVQAKGKNLRISYDVPEHVD
jgi:Ser-tRNA(Ala) deacylase AlaX